MGIDMRERDIISQEVIQDLIQDQEVEIDQEIAEELILIVIIENIILDIAGLDRIRLFLMELIWIYKQD